MKNKYLTILPVMAMMAPLASAAEVKLEDSLDKVAKKVDTDGTYLQVNNLSKDIELLERYGALVLKAIGKEIGEIPEDVDVAKLSTLLGLRDAKAISASAKKVDGAWNNRYYTWTDGSTKGMWSLYGKANEKLSVANFAPATADIAIQTRLDLRKMTAITMEVARQFDKEEMVREFMTKPLPEVGGMTVVQLLSKLNMRINFVVDIDREDRFMPVPSVDLPTVDFMIRVDGAAWAWPLVEDKLVNQPPLQWVKEVEGKVTTYTLPDQMQAAADAQGFSPTIIIDAGKNLMWFGVKKEGLEAAMGDGPKLKDGAAYKKTMATLPKGGNSMMYVSQDFMGEIVGQYEKARDKGLMNGKEFEAMEPLVEKLIKDVAKSPSGLALVLEMDDDGMNTVLRAPFPLKNYYEKISTLIHTGTIFGKNRQFNAEVNEKPARLRKR